MPQEIHPKAFSWSLTVDQDHIDPQNHASNVAVVDWMNQSAWKHSIAVGMNTPAYQALGGMFVVRRHEIDYRLQAMLGDQLLAYTWPTKMEKATAVRQHRIIRQDNGQVVASGMNVWAYIDATTHRPTRIPARIIEAFNPSQFV